MKGKRKSPNRGKRQKNIMRNVDIQGKARKPRRWLMARRIRPKDIAALIATLVTTVAGLYTSVMELKREWNASKKNQTKQSKRPKRLKTPKRSHNKKKPEKKHESKTEPKHEKRETRKRPPGEDSLAG